VSELWQNICNAHVPAVTATSASSYEKLTSRRLLSRHEKEEMKPVRCKDTKASWFHSSDNGSTLAAEEPEFPAWFQSFNNLEIIQRLSFWASVLFPYHPDRAMPAAASILTTGYGSNDNLSVRNDQQCDWRFGARVIFPALAAQKGGQ